MLWIKINRKGLKIYKTIQTKLRKAVIVKKHNVWNFIVIAFDKIKNVKDVIVLDVIILNNSMNNAIMLWPFLLTEILKPLNQKYKVNPIQKDVIVKSQVVKKNIVNAFKLGLNVEKCVNAHNVKIVQGMIKEKE